MKISDKYVFICKKKMYICCVIEEKEEVKKRLRTIYY